MMRSLLTFPPMTFLLGVTFGKITAVSADYDWWDVAWTSAMLLAIGFLLWLYTRNRTQ